MRAALGDPDVFGRVFGGESWSAWRVLLIAAMGEALTDEERAVFESLTGRPPEPAQRVDEAWGISPEGVAGRRAQRPSWRPTLRPFAITSMFWRRASARRFRSCPQASGKLERPSNISTAFSRRFQR